MTTTSTWIRPYDTTLPNGKTQIGAITKDGVVRLDYLDYLEKRTVERVLLADGIQPVRTEWIVFVDGEYRQGHPWQPGDKLPDGADMLEIKAADSREEDEEGET